MSPLPAQPILPPIAPHDAAALAAEAEAYLAAVDAFRAEGRAVEWHGDHRTPRTRRKRSTTAKGWLT